MKYVLTDEDKIFNLRTKLQDARDDLIILISTVNQAFNALDFEKNIILTHTELRVLREGAKYLTKKYGIRKYLEDK